MQFSASIVFTRRKEGKMPDPCETPRHKYIAAHDEYQRLLVQSQQPGTVDAGLQDGVQVKILKPDLLALVEEAKAKLPAAKQAMDEAAARLEECQRMNGIF
jgi:hypothetical protein